MVGSALVKVAPAAAAGVGTLVASRARKSKPDVVVVGRGDQQQDAPVLVPRARRVYHAAERYAWKIAQEETKRVMVHEFMDLLKQPMVLALGTVVIIESLQKAGIVGSIVGTLAEGLAAAPVVVDLTKATAQSVEKVAPAIQSLASALTPMLAALPGGKS
jgi:hypothetical protein